MQHGNEIFWVADQVQNGLYNVQWSSEHFEDKHHHTNKKKSNACTLDELLDTYNSREDIVDDYACSICNRRTQATVSNRVHQYPRVLRIALSRGAYSENKKGLVQTFLNFPIDTFKPKKIFTFPR